MAAGSISLNETEYKRLRWRCRRGMRELDVLLMEFLDSRLDVQDPAELEAFRQLLSMPDPEILALLTGRSVPQDAALGQLVKRILDAG